MVSLSGYIYHIRGWSNGFSYSNTTWKQWMDWSMDSWIVNQQSVTCCSVASLIATCRLYTALLIKRTMLATVYLNWRWQAKQQTMSRVFSLYLKHLPDFASASVWSLVPGCLLLLSFPLIHPHQLTMSLSGKFGPFAHPITVPRNPPTSSQPTR